MVEMPTGHFAYTSAGDDRSVCPIAAHGVRISGQSFFGIMETMMPQSADTPDIATMSFEDALAALEKIVDRLEAGDVPLEDSIRIYERGAALKAHCEQKLKAAELKVERIVLGPEGPKGVERVDET
jgi:exodeoxyribonuclease VII small subunit